MPLVSWGARIISGRHSIAISDSPISTMYTHFPTACVCSKIFCCPFSLLLTIEAAADSIGTSFFYYP